MHHSIKNMNCSRRYSPSEASKIRSWARFPDLRVHYPHISAHAHTQTQQHPPTTPTEQPMPLKGYGFIQVIHVLSPSHFCSLLSFWQEFKVRGPQNRSCKSLKISSFLSLLIMSLFQFCKSETRFQVIHMPWNFWNEWTGRKGEPKESPCPHQVGTLLILEEAGECSNWQSTVKIQNLLWLNEKHSPELKANWTLI